MGKIIQVHHILAFSLAVWVNAESGMGGQSGYLAGWFSNSPSFALHSIIRLSKIG